MRESSLNSKQQAEKKGETMNLSADQTRNWLENMLKSRQTAEKQKNVCFPRKAGPILKLAGFIRSDSLPSNKNEIK